MWCFPCCLVCARHIDTVFVMLLEWTIDSFPAQLFSSNKRHLIKIGWEFRYCNAGHGYSRTRSIAPFTDTWALKCGVAKTHTSYPIYRARVANYHWVWLCTCRSYSKNTQHVGKLLYCLLFQNSFAISHLIFPN